MELISNKTMQGDAHHAELLVFVDECFDRFGADEHHPGYSAGFLMEQHGLRQFKALA